MNPSQLSRERGYEVSDASVRGVWVTATLIAIGTLATLGVVRIMMLGPDNAPAAFGVTGPVASFTHGPHEQTGIQQSWTELERELTATTGAYGWIDREAGIVRIPIDRAMELIVQEHAAEGGEP